jgi:hypothetical protein
VAGERSKVDLGPVINGSNIGTVARSFVYLVRELGFPIVVCGVLWFDLRPRIVELVAVEQRILEVEANLAVRKCIPLNQEWVPSPQGYVGPGKHGCPLYEWIAPKPAEVEGS